MTSLRSQLIVEKDEREELETKLKEISERSGGRLPFLMVRIIAFSKCDILCEV